MTLQIKMVNCDETVIGIIFKCNSCTVLVVRRFGIIIIIVNHTMHNAALPLTTIFNST